MLLINYRPEDIIRRLNKIEFLLGDARLQSLCCLLEKGTPYNLKLVSEIIEAYERSLNRSAA